MNKIDLGGAFQQAKLFARRRAPDILTGLGIAGMITTVILAVKATPEAMKKIEEAKEEHHHKKLTTKQTIQAAWKCYIPPAVTGTVSTGCLIWASVENGRRNAALAAAYSLAETNWRDLAEKTREIVGDKKTEEILDAVDQKRMEQHPLPAPEDDEAIERGNGERLIKICDPFGRYFYSNRSLIDKAVNKLNAQMATNFLPYVSLNEFLREIEAPSLDVAGDKLGWNLNRGLIEIRYSSHWVNDHTIRGCFSFTKEGKPDYGYDYA